MYQQISHCMPQEDKKSTHDYFGEVKIQDTFQGF